MKFVRITTTLHVAQHNSWLKPGCSIWYFDEDGILQQAQLSEFTQEELHEGIRNRQIYILWGEKVERSNDPDFLPRRRMHIARDILRSPLHRRGAGGEAQSPTKKS
jgi:hypothetical protein